MRTTKQLSITLPNNMADALKERVASGAYASESEVVRDGLRALFAREEAVETWLRTEVVAAYDELREDPSQTIGSEQMRTHLAELHSRRLAEGGP
ncbi:ribbon-helix-helix domain-containing protein [Ornithinimicrobium cryptoxanthini]|uniref:ribbon-helix-helix domain-containing protein n=1 Tax=Ornithinimicrobium cryptoxanthini TaxID=2934161 RepID=UPI0021189B9F|nr:type II toxin-antitoxin system ParD family antitoxin [Ornithinimicrobium cryptoxanthini]